MPPSFIDRNKRKSVWALLLLLLRWRKGLVPLLLLMVLLLFIFVAPSNWVGMVAAALTKFPGGSWIVSHLGISDDQLAGKGAGSFEELMAGFKAARDSRSAGYGMFFGGAAAGGRSGNPLDMIRGGAENGTKPTDLAGKVKGGTSISGIVNPEDARKAGGTAVALTEDDVTGERAGLVGSAFAGGDQFGAFRGLGSLNAGGAGGTGLGGAAGALGKTGPFASKGFFRGGNAPATSDRLKTALDSTSVPRVAAARFPGLTGKMSRSAQGLGTRSLRTGGTGSRTSVTGGGAMAQLAESRALSQTARDPSCTADNSCPPEYASTANGASFDGGQVNSSQGTVSASAGGGAPPSIDGISTPNPTPPTTPDVCSQLCEACKVATDAGSCHGQSTQAKQMTDDFSAVAKDLADKCKAAANSGCDDDAMNACNAMKPKETAACCRMQKAQIVDFKACPMMGTPPSEADICSKCAEDQGVTQVQVDAGTSSCYDSGGGDGASSESCSEDYNTVNVNYCSDPSVAAQYGLKDPCGNTDTDPPCNDPSCLTYPKDPNAPPPPDVTCPPAGCSCP